MKTLRLCRKFIRRRLSDMCAYHEGTGVVIDNVEIRDEDSLDILYECLINVVIAYIKHGRQRKEGAMSRLEFEYMFTPQFYLSEDPQKYLEEHRETNDHRLIMHCLDNYERMEYARYRLQIVSIFMTINNFRNMF